MVRFFLFIFFISVTAWSKNQCDTLSQEERSSYSQQAYYTYQKIKKNIQLFEYDISKLVAGIYTNLNKVCLELKDMGVEKSELDEFLRTNAQELLKKKISKAKAKSDYYDISTDVEEINSFAREKGLAINDSNNLSDLKRVSIKNQEDERQKCLPEVDMSHKFQDIPMRNQEDKGWCFAYAVADLLSVNTGQNISAIDLGFRYYDTFWNSLRSGSGGIQKFDGGRPLELLEDILDEKVCLEVEVPSSYFLFLSTKDLMAEVQQLKIKYDSIRGNDQNDHFSSTHKRKKARKYAHGIVCKKERIFNQLFPNLEMQDFIDILEHSTKWTYLKKLRDKSCRSMASIQESGLQPKYKNSEKPKELYDQVDKWINKGNVVGFNYLSSFLKKKGEYDPKSGHASLIIGRKYNQEKKSCEYLVRNSWGKNCSTYDEKSVTCDPKTGLLHISKSELNNSIREVWTLENE